MSHTIELKKVSKFYSNKDTVSTGFSRIDLNLDMGEFVVITGESGSGKSTLLNVISGLDSYEEGEMFVCGEDTSGFRTEDYERYRKTYIGNIFQDFNLVNSYSVYQNIELGMLLSGKKSRECKHRIKELIELVGLTEYTRVKVSKLSGGQKQRVAIARALAKDAPIIVADEPTGNLDSESACNVMETLSKISRDKLVVIVTHNYEQAEPYVTRKLTMHDGKIIEDKVIKERAAAPDWANTSDSRATVASEDLYDALTDLADDEPTSYAGSDFSDREREAIRKQGGRAKRAAALENELGSTDPLVGKMKLGQQYKLGIRNTFNLPAKFILLLVVYMFVTAAVLGQYSATKQSLHQTDTLGYNDFFPSADVNRIVVKKTDKTPFTQEELDKIGKMENIKSIVKNDIGIDNGAMLESDEYDISGPIYSASALTQDQLTYGKLPESDNEIVLRVDSFSWIYDVFKNEGEALIGKEYYIDGASMLGDGSQESQRLTSGKVKIVGIVLEEGDDDANVMGSYGSALIYVTDALSDSVLRKYVANSSKTIVNYTGTKVTTESGTVVYPTGVLDEGEAYIFEPTAYQYYDEGAAKGKKIDITIENMYFTSKLEGVTIYRALTLENAKRILGISKEDYDLYANRVYVSQADYNKLYNRGTFQVSVFMDNEIKSDETVKALNDAGYQTLPIKDSLSDITGGFGFVVELFSLGWLLIMFIVLFFIAYGVIRLIMRSRNSYYSTLRILGANKANTDRILRVELVLMMLLAFAVIMGLILLVKNSVLSIAAIAMRIQFLTPMDYGVLFALMLIMSLLIAKRYSRKLFKSSAMNVYREEA